MIMRSPIVAMLWENWRLTRVEAAWRLGLGIVLGSVAILLLDNGPTIAFWIILWTNAVIWLSIAKLNGGRFMDGYKPGFPLYLLYTRPVPTVVLVGVAVFYDALSGAVLYLVTAALVGFAFDQPLPLFSVAAWILLSRLAYTCIQWSLANRVVQWAGSMAVYWPLFVLLQNRVVAPARVEFSLAENVAMVLLGLVAFGLTVAGVARQRRGDAVASVPRAARTGGYPDWMVSLFRFSCPTSSATKAQVWFELKSSGLPVLSIGLAMALLIFLLYAIGIVVAPVRPAAVAAPIMFGIPLLLFLLGGNAFGIRKKQGRTYVSAFEATQPSNTARLAGIKVLVRTACVMVALVAVIASLWISSSLVGTWGQWLVDGKKDALPGLLKSRQELAGALWGLTGYALAALTVILSVAVALLVASLAAIKALWMRFPRRLLVAGSLLLLYCLALLLLAWGASRGMGTKLLLAGILRVSPWVALAALVLATIYLLCDGIAQRAVTMRYLCAGLAISAGFGALLLAVLSRAEAPLAAWMLWPALLLLMASILAPWSLSRIRHT